MSVYLAALQTFPSRLDDFQHIFDVKYIEVTFHHPFLNFPSCFQIYGTFLLSFSPNNYPMACIKSHEDVQLGFFTKFSNQIASYHHFLVLIKTTVLFSTHKGASVYYIQGPLLASKPWRQNLSVLQQGLVGTVIHSICIFLV